MKKYIKKAADIFLLKISRKSQTDEFAHVYNNKLNNSSADDFNWGNYTDLYKHELKISQKDYKAQLSSGDYSFENQNLTLKRDTLPLHPNHRILYETILQLAPKTVLEVGCGGGDHLRNLSLLAPEIDLNGLDRSIHQIELAATRWEKTKEKIAEFDITLPFSSNLTQVDICYTQAVIMHINTGNGHLVALSNLFKMAKNQVILMENWNSHEFLMDIQFLYDQKMLPWQSIYFYFRRAPELENKPHLLIVSSCKLDYEPLESYSQLKP